VTTALRRIAKGLAGLGIFASAAAGALYIWLALTSVSASELPPLKNGDIIFQTSGSSQSLAILAASRSPLTHMGIIEVNSAGQASVIEAVGPVKSTPLDQWIARGTGGRILITRLNNLTPEDAAKVLSAAHAYDGRPYDIFFHASLDAIYCSELVHLAFMDAMNISLGKFEKAGQLDLDNFAARRLIKSRWQRHPQCQSQGATSFDACFKIILEQELITPAAIAADGKLKTIFSNYGVLQ
jgi:hypothetical protein